MKAALQLTALFTAYATIGAGGEAMMALFAQDAPGMAVEIDPDADFDFDFDFEFQQDFFDDIAASEPDAMQLDEVEVDEDTAAQAGNTIFTPGQIDVEIEDGGLTVAFPADFASQSDVTTDDDTPGAPLSPADTPTVSEVIAVGSEITMLVADDVFGHVAAAVDQRPGACGT